MPRTSEDLELSTSESTKQHKKLICKLCEEGSNTIFGTAKFGKNSNLIKIVEVTNTRHDLSKHFKKQHPSVLFCCYENNEYGKKCNRTFNDQLVLFTHLAIIHGVIQPDTTKIALFKCSEDTRLIQNRLGKQYFLFTSLLSKKKDLNQGGRGTRYNVMKWLFRSCLFSKFYDFLPFFSYMV